MRSSVSYMLSHGPGDPIMSHPDFEQEAHHHGCLLVLVRGIGPSKPRYLQKIFERIQNINNIRIPDSSGQSREIWARYVQDYPVENNDWGDFQTHRRLLGLITVGKYDTQAELDELCRIHESLKVKYTNTLFDSRCVLFGPSNSEEKLVPPTNFKSQAFYYQENDLCADLDPNIVEFIGSLFWILESKRLERSKEKVDKVQLLLAPFEKKDFIGLDMESRNNKKRCVGRITKNLADLTLQAGLVAESLTLFSTASETLRAISDSLWLGAANEGLCAASTILLYPKKRRHSSQQQKGADHADPTTATAINHKTEMTNSALHTNSSSTSSISSTASTVSTASSSSTNSSTSSGSSSDKKTELNQTPPNILTPEDIVAKYRDAIINYSKYRHAAIIETEAALKAARISISQNHKLNVAMFLQNALYINLNLTEIERVQRFDTLNELYQKIGFKRKASFCQRLAAWRHVAQTNNNPDWPQSYKLMLESAPGYRLSMDPLEMLRRKNSGWPCLQIDLIQQLVVACRRIGHSALATRHMTFLLQTMWHHLTTAEQEEMALQLQKLSSMCEGSPVPLVLENGLVIPPANLTELPVCQMFQVKNLLAHMQPQKIQIEKVETGPFLFTPIHFNSIDRRSQRSKKLDGKIQFNWVQNDVCEVSLKLLNPLPFQLQVQDMRLLTDGVVVEAFPQTVSIAPSGYSMVTLSATPIEAGILEIQGYSTHMLGVKSNCHLKDMHENEYPPHYTIDVLPALPQLQIETSLPQTATFSGLVNADIVVTSAGITMYNGESSECTIKLTNQSAIPIDFIEATMHTALEASVHRKIFQWSNEQLQQALPLKPNESVELVVRIFGDADFLTISSGGGSIAGGGTTTRGPMSSSMSNHNIHGPQSLSGLSASGHASLPSRVSSPTNLPRRTELTSSFRSTQSGHSSLATLSIGGSTLNSSRQLEAQLRFRYSGGEGRSEGFCRQCAVSFSLELLPSAQISNWDVLPAEIPSQFYLVLDVNNLTTQEMSLNYTDKKSILIEAKESCRVPIPVERCPMQELAATCAAASTAEPYIIETPLDILLKTCSQHIADQVRLNWSLSGTNTQGIASLKGIKLSTEMLDLVTVAPLHWEVSIDDNLINSQSEISCVSGQCVTLGIAIINMSTKSLENLSITVQFYQDYQNGIQNYRLETRVAMSGSNQVLIPVLEPNDRALHECTVIFLTPGRFKTDIQCCMSGSSDGSGGDTAALDTSQSFYTHQAQHLATDRSGQGDSHVWKYIPPVEISVVE